MELDTTKESRDLTCATVLKLTDQIVLIRFKDGVNVELEDAVNLRDTCIELFGEEKFLALIDARNMEGSVDKKASNYFAQNEKVVTQRMAQAIVVNTLALKLLARFYIMVNKPKREVKICTEIEEAMVWLDTKKHLLE